MQCGATYVPIVFLEHVFQDGTWHADQTVWPANPVWAVEPTLRKLGRKAGRPCRAEDVVLFSSHPLCLWHSRHNNSL